MLRKSQSTLFEMIRPLGLSSPLSEPDRYFIEKQKGSVWVTEYNFYSSLGYNRTINNLLYLQTFIIFSLCRCQTLGSMNARSVLLQLWAIMSILKWRVKMDAFKSFSTFLFSEPYTEILGGPNIYLEEGFTMNLTCLVRDSPEPPQYIFWYQNEQVNKYWVFLYSNWIWKCMDNNIFIKSNLFIDLCIINNIKLFALNIIQIIKPIWI